MPAEAGRNEIAKDAAVVPQDDAAANALRAEANNERIKVAIGTCPECSPPFEWPPNPPKEQAKPQPKPELPKEKK